MDAVNGPTSQASAAGLNLAEAVRKTLRRLQDDFKRCPVAYRHFWRRAKELGGSVPESLFLNPLSTPVFLFPWWVEQSLSPSPDIEFQSELMYSSINLLYYVRLLDDAMDRHCNSPELLPVLTFLHSRFQGGFQTLFSGRSRFWEYFYELIDRTTEVTIEDLSLKDVGFGEFMRLAAQKSCAAIIPIAAVICRYNRHEEFDKWSEMWTAFSTWNQMRDDVMDWHRDLSNGTATYLLSEAAKRKTPEEDIPHWMLREGFDWSVEVLDQLATKATELASRIKVPEMQSDLSARYARVASELRFVSATLGRIATIGSG
ncbi:MAG: hypothetical protein JO061_13150 [Acidobacteriaceae bacterium]|nr:hypothetical protein [Acidobacteriaceae bacterium]